MITLYRVNRHSRGLCARAPCLSLTLGRTIERNPIYSRASALIEARLYRRIYVRASAADSVCAVYSPVPFWVSSYPFLYACVCVCVCARVRPTTLSIRRGRISRERERAAAVVVVLLLLECARGNHPSVCPVALKARGNLRSSFSLPPRQKREISPSVRAHSSARASLRLNNFIEVRSSRRKESIAARFRKPDDFVPIVYSIVVVVLVVVAVVAKK